MIENARRAPTPCSQPPTTLGANVEHLVLQGGADLQGYGNRLVNAIYGNTGNNVLDGGIGADALTGNAGNDTYFVDNAGDVVTDNTTKAPTRSIQASIFS